MLLGEGSNSLVFPLSQGASSAWVQHHPGVPPFAEGSLGTVHSWAVPPNPHPSPAAGITSLWHCAGVLQLRWAGGVQGPWHCGQSEGAIPLRSLLVVFPSRAPGFFWMVGGGGRGICSSWPLLGTCPWHHATPRRAAPLLSHPAAGAQPTLPASLLKNELQW